MQQIFVDQKHIACGRLTVTGEDAHHLATVLRMTPGERLRVSTTENNSYLCEVECADPDGVTVRILEEVSTTEPDTLIRLFQALPKGDRMEMIVEKAVELGVHTIVPVEMERCVVKWDEKKKANRLRRYRAIAESAARQSKRSRIPEVAGVVTFLQAVELAQECDVQLVPYECKEGMAATGEALKKIRPGRSVAIIIGPEGGFAPSEISLLSAKGTMDIISLGKRILRTDTAAVTAMSMVMLASELCGGEHGSIS